MKLKVKKMDSRAKLPQFAHLHDAGMDLSANKEIILKSGEFLAVPTGVAMEIPEGFVGLIWDKSGLAINNGLKVLGGVIDAGYRGEVKVGMINLSNKEYKIEKGHKVAQMLIQKIEISKIIEIKELSQTTRGISGFGSTGK